MNFDTPVLIMIYVVGQSVGRLILKTGNSSFLDKGEDIYYFSTIVIRAIPDFRI